MWVGFWKPYGFLQELNISTSSVGEKKCDVLSCNKLLRHPELIMQGSLVKAGSHQHCRIVWLL